MSESSFEYYAGNTDSQKREMTEERRNELSRRAKSDAQSLMQGLLRDQLGMTTGRRFPGFTPEMPSIQPYSSVASKQLRMDTEDVIYYAREFKRYCSYGYPPAEA